MNFWKDYDRYSTAHQGELLDLPRDLNIPPMSTQLGCTAPTHLSDDKKHTLLSAEQYILEKIGQIQKRIIIIQDCSIGEQPTEL